MDLTAAESLARNLMAEHGLTDDGWEFKFSHAQARLGSCSYKTKTIHLSRVEAEAAPAEAVRQTMLHEIAHALVGPYVVRYGRTVLAGHGPEWKAKARSIGYTGERTTAMHSRITEGMLTREDLEVGMSVRLHVPGRRLHNTIATVIRVNEKSATVAPANGPGLIRSPFALLRRTDQEAAADTAAETAPAAPNPAGGDGVPVRVGMEVRVHMPGNRYHNATGVIDKINPKTVGVVLDNHRGAINATVGALRTLDDEAVIRPALPSRHTPDFGASVTQFHRKMPVVVNYPGSKYHGRTGKVDRVNTKTITIELDNGGGFLRVTPSILESAKPAAQAA